MSIHHGDSALRVKSFAAVLTLVCGLAGATASADPVRIVVLSRYSEAVASAAEQFEARNGKGLIQLELAESAIEPTKVRQADVVFVHYMSATVFARLAPELKAAAARGAVALAVPSDNMERQWGVKADTALYPKAEA
ncbi:MAG: hypothetical protein ABMA15_27900, partial [Vicinamibacterales bacterium]